MQRPNTEKSIVLTPEQIAQAPDAVREWLKNVLGNDERLEQGFVLERAGTTTSGDGLAICSILEIKTLLHELGDDFLVCQILFALGCEYYNPKTGERRGHVISLADFLHLTDARDIFAIHRGLDAINGALQRMRHDPFATIYRPDGFGGAHVNVRTQLAIYRLWQRLLRLTALQRRPHAATERAPNSAAAA